MGLSRPQQIGNVTHNQLTGRGESDSHPITSISDLFETLSGLNTVLGGKLSINDIVNDLETGGIDKPASAEMIKTLNDMIQLINVEGMLTVGDVQDTLTSTETGKPLSANKGRELFQFANDGKGLIATAITNRGVVASSEDTFPTLAGKIGEIAPAPSVIGNVTADKVLAPYTFSTETLTGATGTMTDRGAYNVTPGASAVNIPVGYHNGSGVVSAVAGLSAGNVAYNVNVGGVTGSYKGKGNAVAGDVLASKTFSTDTLSEATGTMVNRGAVTLTPGASAVTIPVGYHNGSGIVSAVQNLNAGNIKDKVVVGGVTGTYKGGSIYGKGKGQLSTYQLFIFGFDPFYKGYK
jgi:hypothetical protein